MNNGCYGLPTEKLMFRAILFTPGDFIQPIAHSAVSCNSQSTANGSISCACPPSCIQKTGLWVCGCTGTGQYGYMIDGVILPIDTSSSTWASRMYTWRSGGSPTLLLGFEFENSIVLQAVEIYLFFYPPWGIGFTDITVFIGRDFPNFIKLIGGDLGSAVLTTDMQNRENLIRVSIPLRIDHVSTVYSIEFETSTPSSSRWVHIAEVKFSDQPIPEVTSPNPTTLQTGGE